MIWRLIIALAAFSAPLTSASATDVMGRGAGAHTCAEFAQDYARNPDTVEVLYFSWAQGYMTATNVAIAAATNTYRDLGGSVADQQAHIRSYCDAHPLAAYSDAVMNLYQTFPRKQPREAGDANALQPPKPPVRRKP